MEDEILQVDPLFAGMTRTPIIAGIPFLAFLLEWMFGFFLLIATGNPFLLGIVAPIHGLIYAISANDPGIFDDIRIWLITKAKCMNFNFWEARSFAASSVERYKGWD